MITLFSVLLLVSDTSATTVQPEPSAPAAAEATKPKVKEERKICKLEESTTSRTAAKKICLTAAEWREREQREENW